MIKGWLRKTIHCTATCLLATALIACGGSGGSGDSDGGGFIGGGQTTDYTLSLKLGDNNDPVELKSGEQTSLTVSLTEGGAAVSGTVISVAASGAQIEPSSLTSNAMVKQSSPRPRETPAAPRR